VATADTGLKRGLAGACNDGSPLCAVLITALGMRNPRFLPATRDITERKADLEE